MAYNVNVSLTNYSAGTGPQSASVDVSASWTDDSGTPHSVSRSGVTLAQLWTRPAVTPDIKQRIIQDLLWTLVRLDAGVDSE